ncbi:MAG: paraquat-inducible protein A [Gammaproteobacteria bacterium]|nr:paraquat-inducible protein A [Gammaproteobacteria bacterium]
MKDDLSQLFAKKSAYEQGYISCLECGHLLTDKATHCDICHASVSVRKKGGLVTPIAFLLAAFFLFFPANLLPIMGTEAINMHREDTILSGVAHLWHLGSYPIAIIVFVASFITPVFKMLSMSYLCYTCHRQSTKHIMFRTKLYHFTELIGRWSMIDVFVVALLGALVKMGAMATIEPRPGVLAFALVVFLTMFATESFDARLIWDSSQAGYKKEKKNGK